MTPYHGGRMPIRVLATLVLTVAAVTLPRAQGGSPALLSQLTWFDRTGRSLGTTGPVASHGNVELSPDGRRVLVAVLDPRTGTRDLWVHDVESDTRFRLTSTPADENWGVWTRDGQEVIFNSTRSGGLDLYRAPARPDAPATLLLADGMWPVSLAPDGRHLLFVINSPQRGNDVMVLPLFGERMPYPFAQTADAENWATFSPDGRWVAFSSSETGRSEVYVAPFPPTPEGMAAKRQVSSNGGTQARWNRNGREILYIAQDRSLMATAVDGSGATFEIGATERLFQPRFFFLDSHGFDISPDGQRLLVNNLIVSPQEPASIARR